MFYFLKDSGFFIVELVLYIIVLVLYISVLHYSFLISLHVSTYLPCTFWPKMKHSTQGHHAALDAVSSIHL